MRSQDYKRCRQVRHSNYRQRRGCPSAERKAGWKADLLDGTCVQADVTQKSRFALLVDENHVRRSRYVRRDWLRHYKLWNEQTEMSAADLAEPQTYRTSLR